MLVSPVPGAVQALSALGIQFIHSQYLYYFSHLLLRLIILLRFNKITLNKVPYSLFLNSQHIYLSTIIPIITYTAGFKNLLHDLGEDGWIVDI